MMDKKSIPNGGLRLLLHAGWSSIMHTSGAVTYDYEALLELWNVYQHGKLKYTEKYMPSVTLSTTKFTWTAMELNLGTNNEKLTQNCLRYGMTTSDSTVTILMQTYGCSVALLYILFPYLVQLQYRRVNNEMHKQVYIPMGYDIT